MSDVAASSLLLLAPWSRAGLGRAWLPLSTSMSLPEPPDSESVL